MTTPRIPTQRFRRRRISDEAIACFQTCREIEAAGQQKERHGEYREAAVRLNYRLLGRQVWETDVLLARSPFPPDWMDWLKREDYRRAHNIFVALEEGLADKEARAAIERRVRGR